VPVMVTTVPPPVDPWFGEIGIALLPCSRRMRLGGQQVAAAAGRVGAGRRRMRRPRVSESECGCGRALRAAVTGPFGAVLGKRARRVPATGARARRGGRQPNPGPGLEDPEKGVGSMRTAVRMTPSGT